MVQTGYCRRSLNIVYTVLYQPVQNLDKCQYDKHSHKLHVKLVSEDCHSQASLHNSLADPVVYPLHLGFPQGAEEDLQVS